MQFPYKLSLITLTLVVSACSGDDSDPTESPTPTSAPSATPSPTISPTPTATPSSTLTPTPSPTPSPSPTQAPPLFSEVGIFDVNYNLFRGVYAFLENGDFFGIHFVINNTPLAGHPRGTLSEGNTTNNRDSIAWANFIDDAQMLGVQEPNPNFGRTFTSDTMVDVTIQGSFGVFSTTGVGPRPWFSGSSNNLYDDPIPLDSLAGTYQGIMRTVGIGEPQQPVSDFTLDNAGNFLVTVSECDYSGLLTQVGATGLYSATATVSGNGCMMPSVLTGLLMPLSFEENVAEFTLMLNSDDEQNTAVFLFEM